jgi:hypothetical protein
LRDLIKDTAAQCDSGTVRHFLGQFMGESGMTPIEMRTRLQAGHFDSR